MGNCLNCLDPENDNNDEDSMQSEVLEDTIQENRQCEIENTLDWREPTVEELNVLSNVNISTNLIKSNKSMLISLPSTHAETLKIKELFRIKAPKDFVIEDVQKIDNPYLKACFSFKKKEYEIMYGKNNVKEINVFHGTKADLITPIINGNFNWRFVKQNKFGDGVSFSPYSYYSSNYCDDANLKCMFVVKMLKCTSYVCSRDYSTEIPPINPETELPYDTSENSTGTVFVKYADDEFLPEYIIYFSGNKAKKTVTVHNQVHTGSSCGKGASARITSYVKNNNRPQYSQFSKKSGGHNTNTGFKTYRGSQRGIYRKRL